MLRHFKETDGGKRHFTLGAKGARRASRTELKLFQAVIYFVMFEIFVVPLRRRVPKSGQPRHGGNAVMGHRQE